MSKQKEMKKTMVEALTMEPEPKETETEAQAGKRRRRSLIDYDPLPEASKKLTRTRRRKDPALKKSYSMTVLMTEEMHRRLKNIAEIQGLSMNGIVTRLIRRYIMTHDIDLTDL